VYEHSSVWTIEGADGTTVTFNDGGPWRLEEVTGFDSPNVRQDVEDLPEADGAVAGDFFFGSRPVTMRGHIAAATAAERNSAVVGLQRALRGLRSDVTLKSQPSGLPAMQAAARLDNVRVTGGYVKEFLIALVCADPLVYSQTVETQSVLVIPTNFGVAWPIAWPATWGGGVGDTTPLNVTNDGNFDTAPLLRVHGAVTEPRVSNDTTGKTLYLDGVVLAQGEYVDIDMAARTAVRSNGANVYDSVRFPGSAWWTLAPGDNSIALRGLTIGTGAELRVTYRDAWA
jgi:hypothetical protein